MHAVPIGPLRPPCPPTSARPRSGLWVVGAPRWRTSDRRPQWNRHPQNPIELLHIPSTAGENVRPASHSELSQKITALTNLTAQQLRDEWRRLYRGQPPRVSRDLLVRAIAYRMQELAYGGLSKATQRKLVTLTKELETNGSIVPDPRP